MKQNGNRSGLGVVVFALALLILSTLPAAAQETSGGFAGGSVKIGYDNRACDATLAGAIRYNSATSCAEYCNGSAWACPSPCGDSTSGFFVLTQGTWNGDLVTAAGGGMSGLDAGNALCLTDLTTYDWNCKSRAQSRGLLNSTKVKAFLCDASTCNNATADTIYYFARSNDPARGGNKFKTNGSGVGPQEQSYWDNFYNMGDTETLWTGRGGGTNLAWTTTPVANTCSGWTNSTSGVFGRRGNTNNYSNNRWALGDIACNNVFNLVCFVHP